MDVEQPSDLPVEVHFASLDTRPKEGTRTYIKDRPGQSQAIGLDESTNRDTVANLQICHDSPFLDQVLADIQKLSLLRQPGANTFPVLLAKRALHRLTTRACPDRSNTNMRYAPCSDSSNNQMMLSNASDHGVLIAFEGLDGSGKTTQRKLFKSWLRHLHADVIVTKWNSSSAFKPIIKHRKAARSLDPTSYAALHAADFWHRHETIIEPSLRDGMVVLADRYIFTGLARDAARHVDRRWDRSLYSGARRPNLIFYFDTAAHVCAERITAAREISFYEAGQDVTGVDDPFQSYLSFAETVRIEYQRLSQDFAFVTIDGSLPIYDQHRLIRDTYISRFGVPAEESVLQPQLSAFLSQVDV